MHRLTIRFIKNKFHRDSTLTIRLNKNDLVNSGFESNKHVSFDWVCSQVSETTDMKWTKTNMEKSLNIPHITHVIYFHFIIYELSLFPRPQSSYQTVSYQYRSLSMNYPVKSNQQSSLNNILKKRFLKRNQWFLASLNQIYFTALKTCVISKLNLPIQKKVQSLSCHCYY